MKILIFEYITGGGFCAGDLPASLAREGSLMLNALLNDAAHLTTHEIVVMLDSRLSLPCSDAYKNISIISVKSSDNVFTVFNNAIQNCDAVWIIAPETNNILCNLTKQVEGSNKLLLSSPSSAIAQCANKLQTFNLLTSHNILTIPTQRLLDLSGFKNLTGLSEFPLVIKPIDGVGCENNFFIQNPEELKQIINSIAHKQNYIIQPFIKGDALSVCALFKHGQAQLICVNRQHLAIKNQQFKLMACDVNIVIDNKGRFQKLLNNIAQAFPELFGYVGIDLIVSDLIYVVEINPRLTSSYSGIHQALGINIAHLVLQSMSEIAVINPTCNQTVFIDIAQENLNATV